ncbi:MAG: helix-turn-helix transcriptional regulator [Neisseriaceae bacterium]|nr:helix-turn-helix transcriptional regulator [Neisseriaceae bacterium]
MAKNMEKFKERLAFLFGENASPTKIARLLQSPLTTINNYWYENKIPKVEMLLKIKQVTNCSIDWLLTGQGDPYLGGNQGNQSTAINQSSTQAIDLTQYLIIFHYQNPNANPLYLQKSILNNHLPQNLTYIQMPDDSMQPLINENDIIIINTEKTTPYNGIYAIKIGETAQIKRLQVQSDHIKITAENQSYQPFQVDSLPTTNIQIIGKVEHLLKAI